jgi:hypothetical protein
LPISVLHLIVKIDASCKNGKDKKVKGKVHPGIGYERPEGEWRNKSTISLSRRQDVGGCSASHPGCFTSWEGDPLPVVQEAGWAPGLSIPR